MQNKKIKQNKKLMRHIIIDEPVNDSNLNIMIEQIADSTIQTTNNQ